MPHCAGCVNGETPSRVQADSLLMDEFAGDLSEEEREVAVNDLTNAGGDEIADAAKTLAA